MRTYSTKEGLVNEFSYRGCLAQFITTNKSGNKYLFRLYCGADVYEEEVSRFLTTEELYAGVDQWCEEKLYAK